MSVPAPALRQTPGSLSDAFEAADPVLTAALRSGLEVVETRLREVADAGHPMLREASTHLVEAGGITHQPFTGPKGVTMLGFMFGPLGGMDDNGNLAGVLDIDWHYQTAKANGAADHIVRKVADTH